MTDPEASAIQEALRQGHLKSVRLRVTIFIAVTLVGVIVALTSTFLLYQSIQGSKADIASIAQAQAQAAQAAQALQGQVKALGATPVVTAPPTMTPSQGAQTPTVSNADVETAVAAYLSDHPAASAQQVATAVYSFCGQASRPCVGPVGAPGPSGSAGVAGVQGDQGASGADGAQGAAGANATDAQVSAAVTAYCSAHGDCTGPQGATGAPGPQGATGPAGTNGKPPQSWSWTDLLGAEHTCVRSNTDDQSPAYSCS